ncbi:MAG TPA: hypothetical protein VLF91_02700 [Candidatus Saccharimonadales bacterium]|nr:hypothetical protein [Candidatus Saccharimonadales bacterium]
MKNIKKLPADYLAVLRFILRTGQQDLTALAESVRISRDRLVHIVESLQHKGLVLISRSAYSEGWISLSSKGRRLARLIAPDQSFAT